ncbi:amino acid permease [Streptomyces anulatus]|uniref:Amino acid permease n=1 Tax=Streptomyces anulatus TaxID=1892 RepID=A0ABZ1ZQH0_STRAQ|nr:amino acid permease [Streptomyces anulatus]WSU28839.1 amino acid permease [Streptomyces anulatus]
MTHAEPEAEARPAVKLTLLTLTAMVVGSMVGAGVFSLPRRFAQETGVAGALIAWAVAGTGMLMLAFVFQTPAVRRPDLDAGVYAYATKSRREQGRRLFSPGEAVICAVSVAGAVAGIVALAAGWIEL